MNRPCDNQTGERALQAACSPMWTYARAYLKWLRTLYGRDALRILLNIYVEDLGYAYEEANSDHEEQSEEGRQKKGRNEEEGRQAQEAREAQEEGCGKGEAAEEKRSEGFQEGGQEAPDEAETKRPGCAGSAAPRG